MGGRSPKPVNESWVDVVTPSALRRVVSAVLYGRFAHFLVDSRCGQ